MIKLRFVQAPGLASKAIEIFERGWASHVDAVLPDGFPGAGMLLGARSDAVGGMPPGVRIRPFGYEIVDRAVTVALACSPAVEGKWVQFLMGQCGKPYDELAIAAFPADRDWRETDSWFCSELQARALEVCGFFPAPINTPANEITPRDLLLMTSGWAV